MNKISAIYQRARAYTFNAHNLAVLATSLPPCIQIVYLIIHNNNRLVPVLANTPLLPAHVHTLTPRSSRKMRHRKFNNTPYAHKQT